jgi:hypothetical protein
LGLADFDAPDLRVASLLRCSCDGATAKQIELAKHALEYAAADARALNTRDRLCGGAAQLPRCASSIGYPVELPPADGSLTLWVLSTLPRPAVIVEGRYGDLLSVQHMGPDFLTNLMTILGVRHPAVLIFLAGTRTLAEDWTYRWVAAARAELSCGRGSSARAADAVP